MPKQQNNFPHTRGGEQNIQRSIAPHKGGRSERFYGRCTPQIKQMMNEIKQKTGETAGDLFEKIILKRYQKIIEDHT